MVPADDVFEEWFEIIGGVPPYEITQLAGPTVEIFHIGRDTMVPPFASGWRWVPSTTGSPHTFTFRATDQLGATTDITYTAAVYANTDTSRFMYISPSGNDTTGTGTRASPKLTLAACWGSTEDTSTHANKQIFFVGGTYDIGTTSGIELDGERITLNNNKPKTYVGAYGTRPRWNNAGTYTNWEISANLRISNLDWGDPVYDAPGVGRRFAQLGSAPVNGGFANIKFIGEIGAPNDGTNNACIYLNDESSEHQRMSFTYIEFEDCQDMLGMQN